MSNVNLYEPIKAIDGQQAPVTVRIATKQRLEEIAGGVPASSARLHAYVLLEALPDELRRRVELAIQAIVAGR